MRESVIEDKINCLKTWHDPLTLSKASRDPWPGAISSLVNCLNTENITTWLAHSKLMWQIQNNYELEASVLQYKQLKTALCYGIASYIKLNPWLSTSRSQYVVKKWS